MCDSSGDDSGEKKEEKEPRLWRNGMDFEPKKTYPPDYSNVPSVRDWQMSPFGNERYDLDEIQRAEKKGAKGKQELEEVKKRLAAAKGEGGEEKEKEAPECPKCKEREEAEKQLQNQPRPNVKCTEEYMYQPYGPRVVPAMSYSRPFTDPPKLYTYLGPSPFAGYRMKVPAPSFHSTVPCSSLEMAGSNVYNSYIPFGPSGEIRLTGDMYVPMGPSTYTLL